MKLSFDTEHTDWPDRVSAGNVAQTTVEIVDDDHPEVDVTFELANYAAREGSTVTVTVE